MPMINFLIVLLEVLATFILSADCVAREGDPNTTLAVLSPNTEVGTFSFVVFASWVG